MDWFGRAGRRRGWLVYYLNKSSKLSPSILGVTPLYKCLEEGANLGRINDAFQKIRCNRIK